MKGWLKVKTASAYADVSAKTIRAWITAGLRHSKVGGLILIKREWLDDFLESYSDAPTIELSDRLVDEIVREVAA